MLTWIYADELVTVRWQHLLIAGTTGAGKSTVLQNIAASILTESPDEHRIIFIDPKRCEFERYRYCVHTEAMGTTTEEIVEIFDGLITMINARLDEMAERDEQLYTWGPKIHLIIDEFADMMLGEDAVKHLKRRIQKICQIGRAAGIQVIAATQCPLRKVIPSEVRANFGLIMGLRTADDVESRTILRRAGCERLPMHGKCLMIDPNFPTIIEKNIPMIPKSELQKLARDMTPESKRKLIPDEQSQGDPDCHEKTK